MVVPMKAWLVTAFYFSPIGEENYCEHIAAFGSLGSCREWLVANGYTPTKDDQRRLKKNRGWEWRQPGEEWVSASIEELG